MRTLKHAVLVVMAAAVVSSCTTPPIKSQSAANEEVVTAQMVLHSSPLAGNSAIVDVSQIDILGLDNDMSAFLDEHVNRRGSQHERLAQLVLAVIGQDRFLLAYDDSTSTASDTFQNRRGNCISFTNMFIAMARDLGLDASYQEVEIPPDWSMENQTYLFSQHINVLVGLRKSADRVVDFNTYSFSTPSDSQIVSDQRARAHYFSNLGVEHMLADNTPLAFAYFRESLREDNNFGSAWLNLGVLHRKEGFAAYAEAAYLEAMEHSSSKLMSMSNLANLYLQEGDTEQAGYYLTRVKSHRMNNPYYRYQLANSAFIDGDYEFAIQNLNFAIRKRKDEDRFYFLLSLSYLMSGEKETAQKWMEKAEEVALESSSKQKYHHKLDLLMNRNNGLEH